MADFQIEVEFQLADTYARDVDLLESIGSALEAIAPETGPSAAIHGERYSVTLVTSDENVLAAYHGAATVIVSAVDRALRERGDALDESAFGALIERMLVEHTPRAHTQGMSSSLAIAPAP